MQSQNSPKQHKAVTPAQIVRVAILIDADPVEALRSRYRFLKEHVEAYKSAYIITGKIDPYFWWWVESAAEMIAVASYAKRFKVRPVVPSSGITDEMIESARSVPINQIVEFIRGTATAFCHDDRHPSAYYGDRTNTLVCPVCNKHFDSIGVLMHRDGMSFPDAVRFLQ